LPRDRYEPGWRSGAHSLGVYLSLLLELAALYEERKECELAIEALSRVVPKSLPTKGRA
jgi:hypothetical protein